SRTAVPTVSGTAADTAVPTVSGTVSDSVADKRRAFRELHESGSFILPNPWDIGGVRRLEALGFKALASTSSGFAWSLGLEDQEESRDQVLRHLSHLVAASHLPINADFENGYATAPSGVAENVRLAAATGVAGVSLEDFGDGALYDVVAATERVAAAREALDAVDPTIVLVGRAEGFLYGHTDIDETISRLVAYSTAGADCLYAPGVTDATHVREIVAAVAPKAVNVLLYEAGMSAAALAELGVRRMSVGGWLARAAWRGFDEAATKLASEGTLPDSFFR